MSSEQPTYGQVAASASYPCPDCGQLTDNLKQYRFVKWFIILLALVIWRGEAHTACPACMRKYLLRRSLLNILPVNLLLSIVCLMVVKAAMTPLHFFLANMLLLVGFVPATVVMTVTTYTKGHSKSLFAPPPQTSGPAPRIVELKSSRVFALLFWVLLIGIVFGFVYWLTTLK